MSENKDTGGGLPLGPTIVMDKSGKVIGKMSNKERDEARAKTKGVTRKEGVARNES